MRLLITRPQADAEALAEILRARGHVALVAPLMEVQVLEGPELPLLGVQAVLATSANGVRALAMRTKRRDLLVFTVGPQTAESARSCGFAEVVSADGDAAALAEFVAANLDPAKGPLLHAAGAETAGRLSQALQARGFSVEVTVLYEAIPVTKLPDLADAVLRDGTLDGVLLFSPRSAKIFATLVTEAKLAQACERVEAYCISAATAAALTPVIFSRVSVAGVPNQDAMLALIPPPAPGP
jgi:uroporphyrinogen-III synthase